MSENPVESTALLLLADEIAAKSGIRLIKSIDCKYLSRDIYLVTGANLSETTLKRFFGFAESPYLLSGYTKNTLSAYLGYTDWAAFLYKKLHTNRHNKEGRYWNELRDNALSISSYTYSALKNRSGISYKYTIHRKFAEQEIRYFLESDFMASSFVAPAGYGKSIMLTRLVEKFWLSGNAEFPDDIIWFVSGQTIGGLMNKGFDLNNWFMQQLGLAGLENIPEYFRQHPAEREGRLIMILDGFDEQLHREEDLQIFYARMLDMICLNNTCPWIKLIVSSRPATWAFAAEQIRESAFLSSHWYMGNLFRKESLINFPLLTQDETTEIFSNFSGKDNTSIASGADINRQFKNPVYLQLLFQMKMIGPEKGIDPLKYNLYDLVATFILQKIYQNRYSSEKVAIIKRYIEFTRLDENSADKSLLITEHDDLNKGYQELISIGIFTEENLSTGMEFKKTVSINHPNLAEYFIAMELVTSSRHLSTGMICKEAVRGYQSSRYLIPVLKWLIYFGVRNTGPEELSVPTGLNLSFSEEQDLRQFIQEMNLFILNQPDIA